jgi:23S rRNA (guanosine2251-2'-O)-methyltransferase
MNRKLKTDELQRLSNDEFKQTTKIPVAVVLDDVRSMNNIGSVFRTCDAFLIEKIYLCGITAKPPHRDINKTALGATETVSWEYHSSAAELIAELKKSGHQIYAVELAEKTTLLHHFEPNFQQKTVLIFGNEVKGVNQTLMDMTDGCIEIPQEGTKHSLNISVCAGIVLWKFWEKWNGGEGR